MIIRSLEESDRREGFHSGESSLDSFFALHAWNNHVNGISRVYVAVETEASPDVEGRLEIRLPRYPIPAFKIGRLAVDEAFRRCRSCCRRSQY